MSWCSDWRIDLRSFSEIVESLSLSSMEKRSFSSWIWEVDCKELVSWVFCAYLIGFVLG